jgi:transposase
MEARYGLTHKCRKCWREARFYKIGSEQAFACQWCGDHIHPCVGTLFENTHLPLQWWFHAIYLFMRSQRGIPAKELERQLAVPYKTAWRMAREIRIHMGLSSVNTARSRRSEDNERSRAGIRKSKEKRSRGTEGKSVIFGKNFFQK